jgi:hypothetical protein
MHQMYAGTHAMMKGTTLLHTVENCAATCEQMITHLLHMTDVHMRKTQIQHLRDCATICATFVCYLSRQSVFSKATANLCAYICEVCGQECARFPDAESQSCSRICLHCAQECRTFAAAR